MTDALKSSLKDRSELSRMKSGGAAQPTDAIEGFTARPAAIGQGAKMSGYGKMASMGKKSGAKNTIGAAANPKAPKIGMAAKSAGIKSVTSGMGAKAR